MYFYIKKKEAIFVLISYDCEISWISPIVLFIPNINHTVDPIVREK